MDELLESMVVADISPKPQPDWIDIESDCGGCCVFNTPQPEISVILFGLVGKAHDCHARVNMENIKNDLCSYTRFATYWEKSRT